MFFPFTVKGTLREALLQGLTALGTINGQLTQVGLEASMPVREVFPFLSQNVK